MMITESLAEATAFIREHGSEFQPCAYYDKHLDCIRVRIHNCSTVENRLSSIFTMVYSNRTQEAVGFNIKGVKLLLKRLGIETDHVVILTDIIDAIVREYPDEAVAKVQRQFAGDIEGMEVELEAA